MSAKRALESRKCSPTPGELLRLGTPVGGAESDMAAGWKALIGSAYWLWRPRKLSSRDCACTAPCLSNEPPTPMPASLPHDSPGGTGTQQQRPGCLPARAAPPPGPAGPALQACVHQAKPQGLIPRSIDVGSGGPTRTRAAASASPAGLRS